VKILIFSKHFWPDNFKINIIAKELSKKKHNITIITSDPNYHTFNKIRKYNYFFFMKKKKWNNINIYYIPSYKKKNFKWINIFIEYLIFLVSSLFFCNFFLNKKYDIIFVFGTSPILQAFPAIYYSKIKKIPLILWVQDLWPDSLQDTGYVNSSLILKLIKLFVKFIYRNSNLILVQSDAFIKNIKNNFNISFSKKIFTHYNFSEEGFVKSRLKENKNKNILITYAGNFGNAQDFETLKLAMRNKNLDSNIYFQLIGSGKKFYEINKYILDYNLSNRVKIINYLQPKILRKYLIKSDAFFITLNEGRALNDTIPGKFQTYLSFGKPIIVNSRGILNKLIKKNDIGFFNEPGDYLQLVKNFNKISKLTLNKKKKIYNNLKKMYYKSFCKQTNINNLEKYFFKVYKSYNS